MANAYCHIFAFVEEFIIPMVTKGLEGCLWDVVKLRSLLRFARRSSSIRSSFGARWLCSRLDQVRLDPRSGRCREGRAEQVAAGRPVLDHADRMVYPAPLPRYVRDASGLDELFRDLLRFHRMEEAQHAKLDTLLIDEIAEKATLEEREAAIDELLELGGAIDGLLSQQIGWGIPILERGTGRQVHGSGARGDHDEDPARLAMDVPGLGIGASQLRQTRQGADERRTRKDQGRC